MPSHPSPATVRDRFGDLTVWKRGDQRAPHKPLLVLYALAELERGERWVSFREVDDKLERLLIEFGPPRKRHHPEYPFWRLQNDGVWTVSHDEELTRRASNSDPLKSELKAYDVHAGLDAVGHRTMQRQARDPDFRINVLRAYDFQCAICGFDLKLDARPIGLEAAHIRWKQAGGPDKVTNGLALYALHHKMLDKGAVHISSELRLFVAEAVHGSAPHIDRLRGRHGRPHFCRVISALLHKSSDSSRISRLNENPRMTDDQELIPRKELMDLTRKARGRRKQAEVAEELDVSQSAISQAETQEDASLDDLRKKIIAHYLDVRVEGPDQYFKVIEKRKH